MTPQDLVAEVMARLRSDLGALDPAVHGEDLDAATELALDDLAVLAQQLEELRQERNSAIHECDLRAEESAAANRLLTDLRTHLVAAEAERNAALERVKMLQETLRLISDGCKLARDDLRPELARIEEVADRALGDSDV